MHDLPRFSDFAPPSATQLLKGIGGLVAAQGIALLGTGYNGATKKPPRGGLALLQIEAKPRPLSYYRNN